MSDQTPNLYVLHSQSSRWGDYGDILITGMTSHLARDNGLLQLERTGPFVPPIALTGVGEIVVTSGFKDALETSGLSGLCFQPVIKKHIVHLGWETWDSTALEPLEYPDTLEPEDYILLRSHDPDLANDMGDLWEISLGTHAQTERESQMFKDRIPAIYLLHSSWDGTDWFHAEGVSRVYVSEKAKEWLEAVVPQWVSLTLSLMR